jgi:hypothetical protein
MVEDTASIIYWSRVLRYEQFPGLPCPQGPSSRDFSFLLVRWICQLFDSGFTISPSVRNFLFFLKRGMNNFLGNGFPGGDRTKSHI